MTFAQCETKNADLDTLVGTEFAGVIIGKGSAVTFNLQDRVFGLVTNQSAFQSHLIVDQVEIARAPKDFTMEELASLPSYVAAIYAVRHCAQVQAGQTVLIHSAAGATGLACVEYCRMIGAKVIATAGSEEKRTFLREKYQLEHVFNSRDLSFVTQTAAIALVDVIVNSLTGIFLSESAKLLSPLGHFIELGKRDLFSNGQLSLASFRSAGTFHVLDLVTLQKHSPERIQSILQDISRLCDEGLLRSIRPMTVFEPSEIDQAFSTFSRGTHQGKVVIRIADSSQPLQVEDDPKEEQHSQGTLFSKGVCEQGTIVISGGLGGLGIEMSR